MSSSSSSVTPINAKQLKSIIKRFIRDLPNNPEGNPWTATDISRVFLKFTPIRQFDPDNCSHKIDLQWALNNQYYNDSIEAANAKLAELQRLCQPK